MGFHDAKSDTSLLTRFTKTSTTLILVYVDDIIITWSSKSEITYIISHLHSRFSLKDIGSLHYFLCIEVLHNPDGSLFLSQAKYMKSLLHKANMLDSNPQPTPMALGLKLSVDDSFSVQDPTYYRSIVGALQYIIVTRLEISFSVNKVCQYMHRPQDHHRSAVKRILRYLKGTCNNGLHLKCSPNMNIMGFCDFDWEFDLMTVSPPLDIVYILGQI
jgi:histone deacetylase 1/2